MLANAPLAGAAPEPLDDGIKVLPALPQIQLAYSDQYLATSVWLGSPIWCVGAVFHPADDGLVTRIGSVKLRRVGRPEGGRARIS